MVSRSIVFFFAKNNPPSEQTGTSARLLGVGYSSGLSFEGGFICSGNELCARY